MKTSTKHAPWYCDSREPASGSAIWPSLHDRQSKPSIHLHLHLPEARPSISLEIRRGSAITGAAGCADKSGRLKWKPVGAGSVRTAGSWSTLQATFKIDHGISAAVFHLRIFHPTARALETSAPTERSGGPRGRDETCYDRRWAGWSPRRS